MKLLFLVTDDWFFVSHRLHLARAAREAGCEVVVVTRCGEKRAQIEAEGIRVLPFAFGRRVRSQLSNLPKIARLTEIYRRERPDVVHHVSFLPIFYGSMAARRAGVPAVVNAVTGLGTAFVPARAGRILRTTLRACYRLSLRRGAVLFQNPDDRALFLERGVVDEQRALVVPGSGVDPELFRPREDPRPEPAEPVILLTARMLWSKGVGTLIEASRLLRERGVPHRLRLVGEPHPTNPDSIPAEVLTRWQADGAAEWLGRRDDVPDLLRDADLVCLPTYYREGVPMSLIEGASTGLPLVTTDTPGCRDIVRHGENGLLVPTEEVVPLADALERLLRDPELRRTMGARSRKLVEERFSRDLVNGAILDLYRRLAPGGWSGVSPAGVGPSLPGVG